MVIPVQAPFYAEKVRQSSVKRQVGGLGTKLRQLEADDDVQADEMLSLVRSWFDGMDRGGRTGVVAAADAVEQVFSVLEHGEPNAIPSPWPSLNELINGWYPGQLIVVAALTGVGKSIMLENVATDAARSGRRVLFCSLEMSAKEITQRTMAHTARVPLTKIRQGRWATDDPDHHAMERASATVIGTPIAFADDSRQTVADVRSRAWEAKQQAARAGGELGMVVVDYLQLLTARDHSLPRHQQVGEMCRGLKALARELQVPVIAAAQMSRASASRANSLPILADLRESGDIEHTADVVMFLHEEMVDDNGRMIATGDVDVIVAKQRAGSKGIRTLAKHGHFSRFAERDQ
jgi:replicative DNA helicase